MTSPVSGEKLYIWLVRCPHHGLVDAGHYSREREWGPEDGCPLFLSNEEECGEPVEKVEVVPVNAPNVLSVEEAHHASQNLAVGAPRYHKEVRPEIEALTKRLAAFAESQEVADA